MPTDLPFKIAAARRILYRDGCDSNVGGHVSARATDEDDAFWVTAFEYFDQTTPDRVCKLGFDLVPRVGDLAFSPAVNFHARIYQTRPDVHAIVLRNRGKVDALTGYLNDERHQLLSHPSRSAFGSDMVKRS